MFLMQKSCKNHHHHNALKGNAGGKKGKLLCCKRIFDWIKGNLAEIQSKNDQNVQKSTFCKKFHESKYSLDFDCL